MRSSLVRLVGARWFPHFPPAGFAHVDGRVDGKTHGRELTLGHFSLETFAEELAFDNFRSGSNTWDLSSGIFRFGVLAWDLSLGNFSL